MYIYHKSHHYFLDSFDNKKQNYVSMIKKNISNSSKCKEIETIECGEIIIGPIGQNFHDTLLCY